MDSLAYANEQLDLISKYDWGRHGESMKDVDAEMIQLKHRIDTMLSIHEFLTQFDAVCIRQIDAGKLSVNEVMCELFVHVLQRFQEEGRRLLLQADEFVKKGFRVPHVAVLRALTQDPGSDLEMAAIARESRTLNEGADAPKESAFDDEVLSALSNADRKIG